MSEMGAGAIGTESEETTDVATAPDAGTTTQREIPEMGLGLLGDRYDEDSAETDATPTDTAPAAPDKGATTTDSAQDHIRQARAEADRYFQQRQQEHQAQVQAFEQQKMQHLQSLAQGNVPQAASQQDTFSPSTARRSAQQLRQQANQATDAQQARALNESAAGLEYLAGAFEQFENQIAEKYGLGNLETINNQVTQLSQAQRNEQFRALKGQVDKAKSDWGADVVEANKGQLAAVEGLLGQVNPLTKAPYTVSDLVGLVTGQTAKQHTAARAQATEKKTVAKNRAARRGAMGSAPERVKGSKENSLARIADTL